jgi:hypothetical protein
MYLHALSLVCVLAEHIDVQWCPQTHLLLLMKDSMQMSQLSH